MRVPEANLLAPSSSHFDLDSDITQVEDDLLELIESGTKHGGGTPRPSNKQGKKTKISRDLLSAEINDCIKVFACLAVCLCEGQEFKEHQVLNFLCGLRGNTSHFAKRTQGEECLPLVQCDGCRSPQELGLGPQGHQSAC